MRISDWSSDVCSSDLPLGILYRRTAQSRPLRLGERGGARRAAAGGGTRAEAGGAARDDQCFDRAGRRPYGGCGLGACARKSGSAARGQSRRMTGSLRFTTEARKNLREISDFIWDVRGSEDVAESFVSQLDERCRHIASLPGI